MQKLRQICDEQVLQLASAPAKKLTRLEELQNSLAEYVAAEKYKEAAEVRDEINRLNLRNRAKE